MMNIEYIRGNKNIEKTIEELKKDNVNLQLALKEGDVMRNLYLYTPLEKLFNPSELGLEGDYGGRLFKVAKVKDKNLYYLIDSMHTVIGFFKEKDDFKCTEEGCDFVAKNKIGLLAHMRKHQ